MSGDYRDISYNDSFTDLMSSLVVVFLLVAVAAILAVKQAKAEKESREARLIRQFQEQESQIQTEKDTLFKSLAKLLNVSDGSSADIAEDGCVKLQNQDAYRLKIQFKSGGNCHGLHFDPTKFALPNASKSFAKSRLSEVIREVCMRQERVTQVTLVGHTDADSLIGAKYRGCSEGQSGRIPEKTIGFCNNVDLSAKRAQEVFYLVRQELRAKDPQLVSGCVDKLFLVAGRGPVEPIKGAWKDEFSAPTSVESEKIANRRVELTVDFRQPHLNTKGY